MALNFKQTEKELTEMVEKDKDNPEIYKKIKDLTFNYLYNVLKPGSELYDYDTIACDIAADIFLRLKKGAKISYWLNYISRILKLYYLRDYQKKNWSVVIDTAGSATLEDSLQQCFVDKSVKKNPINNSLNIIYLEQFEKILNNVLYNSKFNFNSKERLNLQISILLTLLNNKITYFHIEEYLYPYIPILIAQLKTEIINSGLFIEDNVKSTLELDPLLINDELEEN